MPDVSSTKYRIPYKLLKQLSSNVPIIYDAIQVGLIFHVRIVSRLIRVCEGGGMSCSGNVGLAFISILTSANVFIARIRLAFCDDLITLRVELFCPVTSRFITLAPCLFIGMRVIDS